MYVVPIIYSKMTRIDRVATPKLLSFVYVRSCDFFQIQKSDQVLTYKIL